MLSAAANGSAGAATVFAYWNGHYFVFCSSFVLDAGTDPAGSSPGADLRWRGSRDRCVASVQAAAVALKWGAGGHRRPSANPLPSPSVSIHVPAYFGRGDAQSTSRCGLRLDYPNFAAFVIITTRTIRRFWQPIHDHCRALGERSCSSTPKSRTSVLALRTPGPRPPSHQPPPPPPNHRIIYADYVVFRIWLKDLVPASPIPLGLVQSPPDTRATVRCALHHDRNSLGSSISAWPAATSQSIIVHGTMCLIRRTAMEMCGGWPGYSSRGSPISG